MTSATSPRPGAAPRPHATRTLLVLALGALAYSLAQTMLIPALPVLQREFHATSTGVTWTVSGYLVSAAVCTPILGRLGDMYGKKHFLVVALGSFVVGSVVAAAGSSLEMIIIGRVLQGAGGGLFPLAFGIVRDELPRDRVAPSIGLISATFGIGGGGGLVLGGVLLDNASYHWIFWVSAMMAAPAALLTLLLVPESPVRSPGRVDVRGAVVLGVGLAASLIAVSQGNTWGWSDPRTIGLFLAGVVVLCAWVRLERRTPEPLADIGLLTQKAVLRTNVATLLVGFGMFGSFVLIPQLAQLPVATGYGFGLDATHVGLLMLPSALVMLVVGPISGSLGQRVGSKVPLALGAAISGIGLLALAGDHPSQGSVLAFNTFSAVGIGLAFAAMANCIVEVAPQNKVSEATGLNTVIRSIGMALGSQIVASVLTADTVAGSSVPTDGAFTIAFTIVGVGALVGAVAALSIPRRGRPSEAPASAAAPATSQGAAVPEPSSA
jgi:EmrB/QacA subfamily drug resistance transporter